MARKSAQLKNKDLTNTAGSSVEWFDYSSIAGIIYDGTVTVRCQEIRSSSPLCFADFHEPTLFAAAIHKDRALQVSSNDV